MSETSVIFVVLSAALVAAVTVYGGKRFVAKWGRGSVDAGGETSAAKIRAGRNATVRVKGPGATVRDVDAGQDADVRVEQ